MTITTLKPETAAQVTESGEPVSLDTELIRRDGQRWHLELRGVPIQHRGQPHVLYIGRDITQRKQLEADLTKAYNQDADFYAFHRSLQAYRESFSSKSDVMVLDPKNEFFRYLDKSRP